MLQDILVMCLLHQDCEMHGIYQQTFNLVLRTTNKLNGLHNTSAPQLQCFPVWISGSFLNKSASLFLAYVHCFVHRSCGYSNSAPEVTKLNLMSLIQVVFWSLQGSVKSLPICFYFDQFIIWGPVYQDIIIALINQLIDSFCFPAECM